MVLGLEPLDQLDDMLMLEGHEGVLSVHLLGMVADAVLVDNLDRDLFSIGCRRQGAGERRASQPRHSHMDSGATLVAFEEEWPASKPADADAAGGFAD